MFRGGLKFIDNLTARLFTDRVIQRIVERAEGIASGHPRAYDFLLVAYAVGGYVLFVGFFAVLSVLLLSLGTGPSLLSAWFSEPGDADASDIVRPHHYSGVMHVWLMMMVILPVVLAVVVPFLARFRARPPSGLLLLPSEAPRLFSLVEDVTRSLGTNVDKIFLTNQFNCAVVALPQLGKEKHYLYLGYPCLACLSIDQLRAILAHEAAHLSLRHSQAQTIVHQQRATWFTMMNRWRNKRPELYIGFNLFCFWYTPLFGALAFVRAKQQEFDADERARGATTPDTYAKALLAFVIKQHLFSKAFQTELNQSLLDPEAAGLNLFDRSVADCADPSKSQIEAIWKQLWRTDSEEISHTHPCLVRRLQKLGLVPTESTEGWSTDWSEILANEDVRASSLLGDFAGKASEKMSNAFKDANLSHDVSRELAYLQRANAHFKARKLDEALADLDQAIKLNPSSAAAHVSRSTIYMELGKVEKSIDDCNVAIALQPGYSVAFSNRSSAHLMLSHWDEAIRDANTSIKLTPSNPTPYLNRAAALNSQKKTDEAIAEIARAIELNPALADAYKMRGSLYQQSGKCDLAIQDFDKCLELNPQSPAAFELRAYAHVVLKNHDRAVADLTRAIDLGAASADVLITRASILSERGEEEQARKDYDASLGKSVAAPTSLRARTYLGVKFKNWEQAKSDGETALKKHPKEPFVLANYSRALHELGHHSEALPLIEEAMKSMEHPRFYANHARILHGLGRNEEALRNIEKAIEGETYFAFHEVRAKIFRSLGREDDAERETKLALEMEENSKSTAAAKKQSPEAESIPKPGTETKSS